MQVNWFKNGHGVGDEEGEEVVMCVATVPDEMGPRNTRTSPNMKNIILLKQV